MSAGIIQNKISPASGTELNITFDSDVVAGSALGVAITQSVSDSRTFSVSDDVNGAWTEIEQLQGRGSAIFGIVGVSSGTTTVTISVNFSTSFYVQIFEMGGVDTIGSHGNIIESSNVTSHPCTDSPINTNAEAVILAACSCISLYGTATAASGFTLGVDSGTTVTQHRVSSSALTNQDAAWTSATARAYKGCIAEFYESGGGGSTILPISGNLSFTGSLTRKVSYHRTLEGVL